MASYSIGLKANQKEIMYVVAGIAGIIILGAILSRPTTTVAALYDQKRVNVA